jgi:hypothetical protein
MDVMGLACELQPVEAVFQGERDNRGELRMNRPSRLGRRVAALVAVAGFALVPTAAQADTTFYESPLFGITAKPNGVLLVADSGQGIVNGDTGALVAALPAATDVAARAGGGLWATTSGDEGTQKLYFVQRGHATEVADLGEFEERHNPHPDVVESNPFDVADLAGAAALVADAAGNTVLMVRDANHLNADVSSRVKVVAILPNELVSTANVKKIAGCATGGPPDICNLPAMIPAEPVATSVAVGPDGAYYVGELKGFPAPKGESRVWRIDPDARNAKCGQSPKCRVVLDGFTSIIDLAFGPDGRLNVAQLEDESWFALEFADGASAVGGSVHACDLATDRTKADCNEVVAGVPMLTAIAYRGTSLWGTIWALVPEAAPPPFAADVVQLTP